MPKERSRSHDRAGAKQSPPRRAASAVAPSHKRPGPGSVIRRAVLDPGSLTPRDVLQLQRAVGNRASGKLLSAAARPRPVQRKENRTGLPDALKSGVENLSGFSLDDVKVHYNSPKPARLNALAYTQGTDIHVGPGQEQHLPHEAWHAVQQKQGRVRATPQLRGEAINDDPGLEREADLMGLRSSSHQVVQPARPQAEGTAAAVQRLAASPGDSPIQCVTLYRGMKASAAGAATPKLANNATGLGVRDSDVTVGAGVVTAGGMSTSNTSAGVPAFSVSSRYAGGSNAERRTANAAFCWKWSIDTANLPATLTTQNDHGTHVLVKPAANNVSLDDFRTAVQGTQGSWAKIDP